MNMNQSSPYQLISYEEFPEDQYTMAVAEISIDQQHVVAYAKKKTKEGFFWGPASIGVTKNGQKKYYHGYMIESRIREKQILEFIKNATRTLSNGNSIAMTGMVNPSQFSNQQQTAPVSNFSHEAAGNEQLPF